MFRRPEVETHDRAESRIASRTTQRLIEMFVFAAVAGIAFTLVPVWLPALSTFLSGAAPHTYWYVSRASGFVAFGLLWVSMLAGLGITSRLARFWPGMPGSFELHRFTALLGIGFALMHVLVLLGDAYMNYTLAQLLVPFMGSSYKPEWVGFGQIAFYLLLLVSYTFYIRDRIGVYAWRLIHMLSFALFVMSLVHGLYSGTDSPTLLAQALYWTSALTVLGGSIYRVIEARRGRSKVSLSARKLVALPGRAQVPVLSPIRNTDSQ
jgi:predicted ferric reductase